MSACRDLNHNPNKHRGHAINIRHTRDQSGSHFGVIWCETCEEEVNESN